MPFFVMFGLMMCIGYFVPVLTIGFVTWTLPPFNFGDWTVKARVLFCIWTFISVFIAITFAGWVEESRGYSK